MAAAGCVLSSSRILHASSVFSTCRFNCRSPLENDTVLEHIVQDIPALHDAHVRQ